MKCWQPPREEDSFEQYVSKMLDSSINKAVSGKIEDSSLTNYLFKKLPDATLQLVGDQLEKGAIKAA